MALRLNGSSSGYVELDVPADAGSHTLTLPDGGGSSGQYLQTDGSGGLSWQTVTDTTTNLTRGTEVASTSGQAIDFTNLPSGIRIITVIFRDVSKSGTDRFLVELGTGGTPTSSGYDSGAAYVGGGSQGNVDRTDGFTLDGEAGAQYAVVGVMRIYNTSGNTWVSSHAMYNGENYGQVGGGQVTLSGECDMVRVTTTGSNTFDLGNINIFYES